MITTNNYKWKIPDADTLSQSKKLLQDFIIDLDSKLWDASTRAVKNAVFLSGVQSKRVVSNINGGSYKEVTVTDDTLNVGISDITNNIVHYLGLVEIPNNFDEGIPLYLSETEPGEIVDSITDICLGVSVSDYKMLLMPHWSKLLTKNDVGLSEVDNTSDLDKPISNASQLMFDLKAPIKNPIFTGDPQTPTPALHDNSFSLANTSFVSTELSVYDTYVQALINTKIDEALNEAETGHNFLINGDFNIWQEGTTINLSDSSVYTADMWKSFRNNTSGSAVVTKTWNGSVPSLNLPAGYGLSHSQTVVGTIANQTMFTNMIPNVYTLFNTKVKISFYANTTANKDIWVGFSFFFGYIGGVASAATLSAPSVKFSLTPGWKKYECEIEIPTSTKTIGTDSFCRFWVLDQPTTIVTTYFRHFKVWESGKLEPGIRSYSDDLYDCRKFYRNFSTIFSGMVTGATTYYTIFPLDPPMNNIPNISFVTEYSIVRFPAGPGTYSAGTEYITESRVASSTGPLGQWHSVGIADARY